MIIIFAVFGTAHGRKALLIEGGVVSTPQIAVPAEDQFGRKLAKIIGFAHLVDIPGQHPGRRVILSADRTDTAYVSLSGRGRNALGEHSYPVLILLRIARCAIPTNDVVVQYAFQLPMVSFSYLGKMSAAI